MLYWGTSLAYKLEQRLFYLFFITGLFVKLFYEGRKVLGLIVQLWFMELKFEEIL